MTDLEGAGQAVLKYEVEVHHLQINLQAGTAQGRFMLATTFGQVLGSHLPIQGQNVVTLTLNQVRLLVHFFSWEHLQCVLGI